MKVEGLIILSSAVPGLRDLWWVNDGGDGLGFMPFRSEDRGSNWKALSPYPIPGNRFRDMTSLDETTYTVQDKDWIERGTFGHYIVRVPGSPIYGEVISGRAILASQPKHVGVTLNGKTIPVARVDGAAGDIWLATGVGLNLDANWKELPLAVPQPGDVLVVTYYQLTNFVDPTPEARSYYTVVPVLANGNLEHEPGAFGSEIINTLEVDKMDYMQAEMVRRNAWLFEQSGEPAHLLIKRTKGKPCGCKTEGQARTGCEVCFETGIVGGYYGPYDFLFIDPDSAATKELDEGGVKVTRQSRSYLGPGLVVQAGDMIIRKNGERMVISAPVYKSPRGVLLQQDFDVNLLPAGDTRYRVPLRPPLSPIIYDPRTQAPPPDAAGEPVVDPRSNPPDKPWDNARVPVGRTVTFGNIES